jgi:hypothetical protein
MPSLLKPLICPKKLRPLVILEVVFVFCLVLANCQSIPPGSIQSTQTVVLSARVVTSTGTPPPATLTPEPTRTFTPTFTPTITPTLRPTISVEPAGCVRPPDDYTRVDLHGFELNQRTIFMLQHAQELYGGEIDLTGSAITQGSFHDNGAASFGTHLGGGAVDLSVMRKGTWQVMKADIEPLVHALRVAGFAAWLRSYGELFADSPIHIHAIAIGDGELSSEARDQLTGKFGYFRGFTGVPQVNGIPVPDRHGGPVICGWMAQEGYRRMNP